MPEQSERERAEAAAEWLNANGYKIEPMEPTEALPDSRWIKRGLRWMFVWTDCDVIELAKCRGGAILMPEPMAGEFVFDTDGWITKDGEPSPVVIEESTE